MSVKLMSAIWRDGPQNQAERFVLLALADYANDAGECWPSIKGLCEKTCISERGMQSILKRLEVSGWVEIERGGGRRQCNFYRIVTPKADEKTPQMDAETPHELRPINGKTPQHLHLLKTETPQMDAETPQMDAQNPAAAAPEPSITIKEPSKGKPKKPDEAALAFEAWNEVATRHGLPTASKLTDQRKAALQRRVKDAGGIEAFTGLIRVIPQSPFLMGNNPRGWKASLDFIAQPSSFEKLRDGIYHGGKPLEPRPEPTPDEIEQRRAHAERLKQWEDWTNA